MELEPHRSSRKVVVRLDNYEEQDVLSDCFFPPLRLRDRRLHDKTAWPKEGYPYRVSLNKRQLSQLEARLRNGIQDFQELVGDTESLNFWASYTHYSVAKMMLEKVVEYTNPDSGGDVVPFRKRVRHHR